MYELWAKRRPVNGVGHPYEWICNFEREEEKFYMSDQLDRDVFMECLVTCGDRVALYREFDKYQPYNRPQRKLKK